MSLNKVNELARGTVVGSVFTRADPPESAYITIALVVKEHELSQKVFPSTIP